MRPFCGGRGDASLLDSYEPERIAFARRLVATTDRAFTRVTSDGALARFVRLNVAPVVIPLMFHVRGHATPDVSDRLADGDPIPRQQPQRRTRRRVHGGDRLPWVSPDASGADNFAPLTSLDWQVHVYGDAPREIHAACKERSLPLHVFPWTCGVRPCRLQARCSLSGTTRRLRRCWRIPEAAPETLTSYLDARNLRPVA